MKNKFKIVMILIILFIVLATISFSSEMLRLKMKRFFGVKEENVEREVWEETNSRVRGVTQEVGKRLREYNDTESEVEKKAIANNLAKSYPNFDPAKINDKKLRMFFEDCKYGTLKEEY